MFSMLGGRAVFGSAYHVGGTAYCIVWNRSIPSESFLMSGRYKTQDRMREPSNLLECEIGPNSYRS